MANSVYVEPVFPKKNKDKKKMIKGVLYSPLPPKEKEMYFNIRYQYVRRYINVVNSILKTDWLHLWFMHFSPSPRYGIDTCNMNIHFMMFIHVFCYCFCFCVFSVFSYMDIFCFWPAIQVLVVVFPNFWKICIIVAIYCFQYFSLLP